MASTMAPLPRSPSAGRSPAPGAALSSLAAFAAEMVTWLWFANTEQQPSSTQDATGPALSPSSPSRPALRRTASSVVSKLQVQPTPKFLRFTHDILQTTQVSHSVVILSLLYIHRLKHRNHIKPAPGSEYRLTTTAFMIANKVLDDNTYTAKTWSEVSSLELVPLVAGEAEFLKGLDFSLHVTEAEFSSWIRLLEGHVSRRNAQIAKKAQHQPKRQRVDRPTHAEQMVGLGLDGIGLSPTAVHRLEVAQPVERALSSLGAPPLVRANSVNAAQQAQTPCASTSYPTPHTDFLSPHSQHRPSASSTRPHSARQVTPPFAQPLPSSHSHSAPHKRRAADAFDDDGRSPLFSSSAMGPANRRLQSASIARSYSAGAEAAPIRAMYPTRSRQQPPQLQPMPMPYLHPSHNFDPSPTEATFAHRRQHALGSDGVPSLAEANSPRYDPRGGQRRERLVYNSLGQERERGKQHEQYVETVVLPAIRPRSHSRSTSASQPRPGSSSGYAPAFPSHLSISTSPDDRLAPRSVGASPLERGYSNDGYVSFAGQSSVQQNMLPLPLQRALNPYGLASSSGQYGFANAGPPGIHWGTSPRALEAQGWQSHAPGVRSSTP